MEVTAVGWVLTIGVIVALLALDLALGRVRPHAVGRHTPEPLSVPASRRRR